MTIHIAPTGSDRGDGSAQRPFATPQRAQTAARKSKGPVQVVVQAGVYELASPLRFTPADSGQRWSAAPGSKPVFSGGRRLSGWSVGTREGRAVWTLELPEVRAGAWFFTQLWVDGQRRRRPQLPKSGFFRFSDLDGQGDTGYAFTQGPDRAEYPAGSISRFRNLDDVQVVTYQLWFDTHLRIKKLDEQRRIAHFHTRSLGSLRDEGGQFARFILINVGEALSEPGEWYLDRATGVLTYLPLPGEKPESVTVVAPRLIEIVRFQGSRHAAVADVVVENLGMEHNEWSRALDNCGTPQAAIDVPGAVVFERAERCVLYGCELAHLAGYGVETLAGSSGTVIAACTIRDLGGGAVKIGHEGAAGTKSSKEGHGLHPQAATVADCHLHDGGHVYPSAIGVWIGNAGGNRIQHNHIHHFAYTGISFGWSWGYAPTRTWDNRIERNHIHHINHQRLLSDNGGIYSLGIQPGSTVVGNHLHDIACYHYGGWGLYPDEGSSGMQWHDNLVHHVQYCGYSLHYGRFLSVRNNIFAVMDKAMLGAGRADLSCGVAFERNLIWFDRDNLQAEADWNPVLCATRRNLVWNAGSGGVKWHLGSLAGENRGGRWLESVEADPLFADPRSGDFTLHADSPALAIGFKPFNWRKAGVRTRGVLPASWKAYRLPSAPPKALAVARIEAGQLVVVDGLAELPLRVTLTNPSAGRVRGRWRVRLADGATMMADPGPRLEADLVPGGEVVRELRVRLPATHGRQWVQVVGDERSCFSAAVPVRVPTAVPMPRLPAGSPIDSGLDIGVEHAGTAILSGRAAVVGDALAIDLTVRDATMRVDRAKPWLGASVEVFAGAEPTPGTQPQPYQFILIPADAQGPAEVRPVGAAPAPLPGWEITAVDGGWRARVQVPLAALGIDPAAQVFRFDIICNATSPIAGQNSLRLARWGSTGNFNDIFGLAKIEVGTKCSDNVYA